MTRRKKKVNKLIRDIENNENDSLKEAILFLLRSDKSLSKKLNKTKELSDFSYQLFCV